MAIAPTGQESRQQAFLALMAVQQGAFADAALDRVLNRASGLSGVDRRLVTELVYGCVRRSRTLDTLISQFATRPAEQQPPKLRQILRLGLYQLRYLNQIPPAAAVDTTVALVKLNGMNGLAGFVNGLLRQYGRSRETGDPLQLPDDPVQRLGILHSYPDWIVQVWQAQFGWAETEQLCEWMNQTPHLDLRVNQRVIAVEQVEAAMAAANISTQRISGLPYGLRLTSSGAIRDLPGYSEGWWIVQDASAQWVGYLLDPRPGETVIDTCAAPGGKTMHIAELMDDQGTIWACDRAPQRLKKLQENLTRLNLHSVRIQTGDSRSFTQFTEQADRVLLDAPCSGLGTLHRHADARWRQTPESVQQLAQLQQELLAIASTWVKPGGVLVYSTCTLHPLENQAVVQAFLQEHREWAIAPAPEIEQTMLSERVKNRSEYTPDSQSDIAAGMITVLPHRQNMDGFFMVRLTKK